MGMLNELVRRLQTQFQEHQEHRVFQAGVPVKPSTGAACTPGTPVTPQNNNGGETIVKPPAPAPIPAPARTPAQAANDSSVVDWHALDRAYMDHHLQCIQCKAAGRRRGERCATGAALWRGYEGAEPPFTERRAKA